MSDKAKFDFSSTKEPLPILKIEKPMRKEDEYSLMRTTIKCLLGIRKVSLTKVIQEFNNRYPDRQTSTQNFSNKLARDSVRLIELVEISDILGYELQLIPKDPKQSDAPNTSLTPEPLSTKNATSSSVLDMRHRINHSVLTDRKISPRSSAQATKKSFIELFEEGSAICPSQNFGGLIIVGARSEEAAAWLNQQLERDLNYVNEAFCMKQASNIFGVLVNPAVKATENGVYMTHKEHQSEHLKDTDNQE